MILCGQFTKFEMSTLAIFANNQNYHRNRIDINVLKSILIGINDIDFY